MKSDLELKKVLFQIKYKPDLNYFSRFRNAAAELKSYADWQTNDSSIVMIDYAKHCNMIIAHNAISYDQDSKDPELYQTRISEISSVLPGKLEINKTIFIGFRTKHLIHVLLSHDRIVSLLSKKFLTQDADLKKIMPQKQTEMSYIVNYKEDAINYNITVGPLSKKEMPQYLDYNYKLHLLPSSLEREKLRMYDKYPDDAIYLDIDTYINDEIDCCNIEKNYELLRDINLKLVNSLQDYICGDSK